MILHFTYPALPFTFLVTIMNASLCMYNDDIFSMIIEYHGYDSYAYMGTLSRHHREKWGCNPSPSEPLRKRLKSRKALPNQACNRVTRTSIYHASGSVSRLRELYMDPSVIVSTKTVASMIRCCAKRGDVGALANIDGWALDSGIRVGEMRSSETMKHAALSGNIRAIDWCMKKGFCMNSDVLASAASTGRLDVVRWLIDHKCQFEPIVTEEAAAQGSMEMIRFLTRKHPYISGKSSAVSYAARNGHADIVEYLVVKGYPVCDMAAGFAALGGNIDILRYFHEKGYPTNMNVCYMAAMNGNLDILKWARDHGYPWDKWTMRMALNRKRPDVVQYVVENGCPSV